MSVGIEFAYKVELRRFCGVVVGDTNLTKFILPDINKSTKELEVFQFPITLQGFPLRGNVCVCVLQVAFYHKMVKGHSLIHSVICFLSLHHSLTQTRGGGYLICGFVLCI